MITIPKIHNRNPPLNKWVCPSCGLAQVPTEAQRSFTRVHFVMSKPRDTDEVGAYLIALRCAEPTCAEVQVDLMYGTGTHGMDGTKDFRLNTNQEHHRVRPPQPFKRWPDCVPDYLRDDYQEACKIRDLSPKASATLSRRAIQGAIRGFCGIDRKTLWQEIEDLKKLVDADKAPKGVESETVDALHHIREIGNIGAHMQRDVDIIVNVDPGEAQALIEVTELIFEQWYVARDKREKRLKAVQDIRVQKDGQIAAAKEAKDNEPPTDD